MKYKGFFQSLRELIVEVAEVAVIVISVELSVALSVALSV
jgi:hypothetical protein